MRRRVGLLAAVIAATSAACGYRARPPAGGDAGAPCTSCADGGPDDGALGDAGATLDEVVCEGVCQGDEWVRQLDPSGGVGQWGRAIATDASGNIFVHGSVLTTTYWVGGFAWLAKLTPAGQLLWEQSIPDMPAGAVATEPDGAVVAVSHSVGLDVQMDVRMVSADGELLWKRTQADYTPADVAIARDGGILVPVVCTMSPDCAFTWAVLRYERDGSASGQLAFHAAGAFLPFELVHGIAVVDDGLLLVGTTLGPDYSTTWVRKLDESGAELWRSDYPESVWVSWDGGYLYGPVIGAAPDGRFALGAGVAAESQPPWGHDAWVARFNREGEQLWAWRNVRPDEGGEESIEGVAIDSRGGVVAGGPLWTGWPRGFVASVRKFAPAGETIWTRTFESREGGSGDDSIAGVALDAHDAVLAVGTSQSSSAPWNPLLVLAYEASAPVTPEPLPPGDCFEWLQWATTRYGQAGTAAVLWIEPGEDTLVAFEPLDDGGAPIEQAAAIEAARLVLGDDFDPTALSFRVDAERLVLWDRPYGARIAVFTPGGTLAVAMRQDLSDDMWVTQMLEPSSWQLRGSAPLDLPCPHVEIRAEGVDFEHAAALPEDRLATSLSLVARTPIPSFVLQQSGAAELVATVVALDGNVPGDELVVLWPAP